MAAMGCAEDRLQHSFEERGGVADLAVEDAFDERSGLYDGDAADAGELAGRGLRLVRVDGEALPAYGARISRVDVADFMMQQIGSRQWAGKGVYISW